MDSSRQFLLGCGDVRTIADRVELHVGPPGRSGVDCGTPGAVSPRTAPGRAADAIDGACRPIDCRRDADEIQQFEPPLFFRCAIGNAAPRSGLIFFPFFFAFSIHSTKAQVRWRNLEFHLSDVSQSASIDGNLHDYGCPLPFWKSAARE